MIRGIVQLCRISRLCGSSLKIQLVLGLSLLLSLDGLRGEGFRNSPPGTFGLGRAGGRIAHVDDASAVTHNPANLVDLASAELQLAPSIIYIHEDYESVNGQRAESKEPWKFLPNLFASTPLDGGKIALGLGVTTPYGLGNEWDLNSSAFQTGGAWRYTAAYSAELMTMNFNPALALKVTEELRIGAGVDVMWSKLTLKQLYPWFLVTQNPTSPDGEMEASGDGTGIGANLGVTYEIAKRHRLALTWRTPVQVDYKGDFDLSNVPPAFGGGSIDSSFGSSIKFPTIISAGYGVKLTDKIRLEADVEWLQFSNFEDLPISVPVGPQLGLPASINQDWKDTWTFGIAGDWEFATNWTLRLGYQFYQSPVPDSTFSPTIPDADQNVITFGLCYRTGHHAFEAAYGLDFYDVREISTAQQPAFNGKYEFTVHLFSLGYRYRF